MFKVLFSIVLLCYLVACIPSRAPSRPEPPTDPNQAIIQLIQQRTLSNTLEMWETNKGKEQAKPVKLECPKVEPVECPKPEKVYIQKIIYKDKEVVEETKESNDDEYLLEDYTQG